MSERTRTPLLVLANPGYPDVTVLDAGLAADLAAFPRPQPGGLRVLSLDDAERLLTVEVYTDRSSETYLVDRAARTHRLLGRAGIAGDAAALAPMEPVTIASRDGLTLHGYLTVPVGRTGTPGPMVLLVHGGPWARDSWRYVDTVQFLANRGYAVLQVNFRGSTGYGRRFTEAAVGEFAGKMHDDLIDGVEWAVKRGSADRERICIMGGSYGGYATLVGLTFTPDVFACGVDLVGMSSLVTLLENAPPYWKLSAVPRFEKYVGDPRRPEDRRRMEARSPLFLAHALKRPLLIIHGANDARVKQLESDQMVAALKAAGRQVEYLVFSEEGHGQYGWSTRLKIYGHIEEFLATHLAPRPVAGR